MINGLQSALSGIQAFEKKLDTASKNIANLDSDGYKRDRVELSSDARGGVKAAVTQVNEPGPQVYQEDSSGQSQLVEKSNVDIAEEMAGLITAKAGVQANVVAAKTSDEMMGTLLNMFG